MEKNTIDVRDFVHRTGNVGLVLISLSVWCFPFTARAQLVSMLTNEPRMAMFLLEYLPVIGAAMLGIGGYCVVREYVGEPLYLGRFPVVYGRPTGRTQETTMDYKTLSAFIIAIGVAALMVGGVQYLNTLPETFDPAKSGQNVFGGRDDLGNALGVFGRNFEHAQGRTDATRTLIIGGVVLFLGIGIRASARANANE